MRLSALLSFLIVSSSFEVALAQNAYFKLGRQAFVEGDFKSAVLQLERSCVIDSTNANAQWMLGYSYYHSENYRKSVTAYTKVIVLKPADASAYYYRARAKGYIAKDVQATPADKEKYLLGAIVDYSKSIEIEPDTKSYQNRGIAYREYAAFKLQPETRFFDRVRGINALKASIADLEKVLTDEPNRSDISMLLEISKEKLAGVLGHH
jgi:tetratricopeptide (TPR) repeat protein